MKTQMFSFVPMGAAVQERVSSVRSQISAWINSPSFVDLLVLYGGDFKPSGHLDIDLERLEHFSDRWDFRRIAREQGVPTDDNLAQGSGSARWLSAKTGFSPEIEARIIDDSAQLGLVQTQEPILPKYDYLLVLGGARLSCRLRPLRAAELIQAGLRASNVVLLGAARPVAESEREATDTYAPGAADEFDLIIAGAKDVFHFDGQDYIEDRHDDPANKNLNWVIRQFRHVFAGQTLHFSAMSAPSSDPLHRRANSADTWNFFLDRAHIVAASALLLITSQIYVPYVQLEALRTIALPRDLHVETIGFSGGHMPKLQGLTNANNYLQEVRSTIQAARRFCLAYPE